MRFAQTPENPKEATVYFCFMGSLKLRDQPWRGDQGDLPDLAVVENFSVDTEGYYDVKGAIVTSNGNLIVRADKHTRFVRTAPPKSRYGLYENANSGSE